MDDACPLSDSCHACGVLGLTAFSGVLRQDIADGLREKSPSERTMTPTAAELGEFESSRARSLVKFSVGNATDDVST